MAENNKDLNCEECKRSNADAENMVNKLVLLAFYPIFGRIPPLLSEAKVGDECRLFLLKPLTISKIYAIIDT